MKGKSIIVLLLTGVAASLLVDCGSGSGTPGGPEQTTITTQLSVNGYLQPWVDATVEGAETSYPPPCNTNLDEWCLLSFYGTTDNLGSYTMVSDAMPANWNISATEASLSGVCPGGGTWSGNLVPIDGAPLVCDKYALGNAVATPSSCSITINTFTGQKMDNCPATVTLTTSGAPLPTSYSLAVSNYSDVAAELYSQSVTALSTTAISAPTPTTVGKTVLIVVDPTTNQVLAAALFTLTEQYTTCKPSTC